MTHKSGEFTPEDLGIEEKSNEEQVKEFDIPKAKSKIGRFGYPITLFFLGILAAFKYLEVDKKTFWIAMAFGTPLGWMWGWYLCNAGPYSAWLFPMDAYLGIEFFGMVLEDWLFYPITGGLFIIVVLKDPIGAVFKCCKAEKIVFDSSKEPKWKCGMELPNEDHFVISAGYAPPDNINLQLFLFWTLCMSAAFGLLFFGLCGRSIALCFGVPAIFLMIHNWKTFDSSHFLRTAVIIIPMEFIWDHWAVGRHQQWVYIKESGMFGNWWFNGIPVEMSPYLGIIASYFIFTLVLTTTKK